MSSCPWRISPPHRQDFSPRNSRKKKEYVITPAGRSAFDAEMARLRELVRNGEKMEDET